MARLSRADMEAALAFAAGLAAAARDRERADLWILVQISQSIALDLATYAEHPSSSEWPLPHDTNLPRRADEWTPTPHEWDVLESEHPFCQYEIRSGDRSGSPRRLTDVVDMRAFRRTEYFALFVPPTHPHKVRMAFPGEHGASWTVEVERGHRNFADRDLLFLDLLRPPLIAYESYRSLAATIDALRTRRPDGWDDRALTARERQVLDLVAGGAGNAAIAERLWISPGTVKKHLDNIYEKLEVGSRTAALARTGRSLVEPEHREA